MKKSILILLSLLVSTAAFANVKPAGTVIPSYCADLTNPDAIRTAVVRVERVCFARVTGQRGQFIVVDSTGTRGSVWEVVGEEEVDNNGSRTQKYELTLLLRGSVGSRGQLISGPHPARPVMFVATQWVRDDVIVRLKGKTPGNLRFDVRHFEAVPTTM